MANRKDEKEEVKLPDQTSGEVSGKSGGAEGSSAFASTNVSRLLSASAVVSGAYAAGAPIISDGIWTKTPENYTEVTPIPRSVNTAASGICTLHWLPCYGVATSVNDPLNLIMKQEYTFIRHANSGARNYEPSDLGIEMLALDSLRSAYAEALRLYQTLNDYTPLNRYRPVEVVKSMGFDFDSFLNNMPQFRINLEKWANIISCYYLPKNITIFARHELLSSVIYTDGSVPQAQMYVFSADGFYSYQVVDHVKGLSIVSKPYDCTYNQFVSIIDGLISAFLLSSDVDLINGDILKAYGTEGIHEGVNLPDAMARVPLVEDYNMLHSIRNACICPVTPITLRVRDTAGGYLTCEPKYNLVSLISSLPGALFNGTLNFLNYTPSPMDVANAVRFKAVPTGYEVVEQESVYCLTYSIETCSTEIIVAASMRTLGSPSYYDGTGVFHNEFVHSGQRFCELLPRYTMVGSETHDNVAQLYDLIATMSNFDWHPEVQMIDNLIRNWDITAGEQVLSYYPVRDAQIQVPIAREDIKQIHDAILYDAFGIDA